MLNGWITFLGIQDKFVEELGLVWRKSIGFLPHAEEWKARNWLRGEDIKVADKPKEKNHMLFSYIYYSWG